MREIRVVLPLLKKYAKMPRARFQHRIPGTTTQSLRFLCLRRHRWAVFAADLDRILTERARRSIAPWNKQQGSLSVIYGVRR